MNKSFVVIVITQRGIIEYEKGFRNYNNANEHYDSKIKYYEDLENSSKEEDGTVIEVSLCEYILNDSRIELNKIIKKQQYYLGNDVYQEDK